MNSYYFPLRPDEFQKTRQHFNRGGTTCVVGSDSTWFHLICNELSCLTLAPISAKKIVIRGRLLDQAVDLLSAIHIARVYAGRRRNYAGQHFWARGYWVSPVGKNEAAVRRYIQEQEKEDQRLDQMERIPL